MNPDNFELVEFDNQHHEDENLFQNLIPETQFQVVDEIKDFNEYVNKDREL